jgi:HK97 family phage portal protein
MVSWLSSLNPFRRRDLASDELGWRMRGERVGGQRPRVTGETALRHSAVWACLRLRADLVSTMPVDVFRRIGGIQVEVNRPAWLDEPAPGVDITEWMWATQCDLDRYGNAFGLITAVDKAGRPARIELLPAGETTVLTEGRRITGYRSCGESFAPEMVWHERQYAAAGSPVGLSPIAAAAMSIGGYLSAQEFAIDWYTSGAHPAGVLRNTATDLSQAQAEEAKAKFRASVQRRDVLAVGKNWEWNPAAGDASSAAFLDEMRYGIGDVCRFLGVPGDMIDAASDGSSITYANVTQRNLQLLVVNLGPALNRRERALSRALSRPQFVKLNSAAAVLRMDPQTRAAVLAGQIASRQLAPSEARAIEDRPPFTDEQLAEFDRLWGAPRQITEAAAARDWGDPVITSTAHDLSPLAIESGWMPPDPERRLA